MSTWKLAPWWTRCRAACQACECWADRAPLRFSLLAVLVLQAIVILAFRPSYDTNDDVFMTMIVSGQGFCPAPDEHLLFSNVVIGQALKRLYTTWPHFPWYGCYLLAVHYLAQVAVLYCGLAMGRNIPAERDDSAAVEKCPTQTSISIRIGLYLIYFAVVELPLLNALQFTTAAFLAAQGGLFLLLFAAQRRALQPNAPLAMTLGAAVGLLLVAALVRLECLLMALLIAAPFGISLARRASRRALVPSGMAVLLAAMLIGLATAYDRAAYEHDPRWSEFFDYNQLRIKFNDYSWTSYTPQTAGLFSTVGWSKNDHEMIARWFFDDPEVYSEAHLRAIVETFPWKTHRLTWNYCWQAVKKLFRDRAVCAVALVLPFLLVSIDPGRRARSTVIGCATMAVALVVFVTWNNKLPPPRVYFPLLSFPLAAALLFPASGRHAGLPGEQERSGSLRSIRDLLGFRPRPSWPRAVVIMLVVGVGMASYRQCRRSLHVYRERRALQAFFAELQPSPRNLLVCWGAAMPYELASPLESQAWWSRQPMLSLAWTQRTPWHEETKRRFGISNMAQAMCERDDVVLLAHRGDLPFYATFAKEHFQADVEFIESHSGGERFVAGRFQRRPESIESISKRSDAKPR